jgi:hypothetical protein
VTEKIDDLHQGASASPVFAYDRVNSALIDVERDVLQRPNARKVLGNSLDLQKWGKSAASIKHSA